MNSVRKVMTDFMLQRPSIDRLMTDKLDDFQLLEEPPLPIRIGSRTIYIGTLTLSNETEFFTQWAKLFTLMASQICNWNLSVEKKNELQAKCNFHLLANGSWIMEFIWRDKWINKNLVNLIGKTVLKQQAYYLDRDLMRKKGQWQNCSWGYFKRNITKETLIQICFLIYYFNFDSVKKNLRLIVEKMNMSSLLETSVPFWLQNMPGLSGKFLLARVPSPASIFDDEPNNSNPPSMQVKDPVIPQELNDGR